MKMRFERNEQRVMKLKNTIDYIQYERPESLIEKGKKIFNLENEDERNFREGLNKNDYKTSSHKNQPEDIASQFSIKGNSIKSEPLQKMDEALYQLFYNQQELNKKLSNKNNTNQVLPSIEPIIFDGDFTKYKEFLISFQTNIESNCDSEIHKLNF